MIHVYMYLSVSIYICVSVCLCECLHWNVKLPTCVTAHPTLTLGVIGSKGLQLRQHGLQTFDRLNQDHIFRAHFFIRFPLAKIQESIWDQNCLEFDQALSECTSSTTFSGVFLGNCVIYFPFVLLFPFFAHGKVGVLTRPSVIARVAIRIYLWQ